jgi:hypothetical protein
MRAVCSILTAILLGAALWPAEAMAYFGPGAGITMLGAIWGVLLAIAFALFALLAWPVRAMLRRRRKPAADASPAGIAGKTDAGA